MTLTVHILYKGKGSNALEFAKEMMQTGIVEEIRRKDGNLKYDYFQPLESTHSILLIDSWKNQAALDEHHQSNTMQKILNLREKYDLTMEVQRYYLDELAIPEYDQSFIRIDQ